MKTGKRRRNNKHSLLSRLVICLLFLAIIIPSVSTQAVVFGATKVPALDDMKKTADNAKKKKSEVPSLDDMKKTAKDAKKQKDSSNKSGSNSSGTQPTEHEKYGHSKETPGDTGTTTNSSGTQPTEHEKYGHSKETPGDTGTTTSSGTTSSGGTSSGGGVSGTSSSSWLNGNTDESIYGDGSKAVDISGDQDDDSDEPDFLSKILIDINIAIANWFNKFMDSIGMSLDSIVMGRVGGHGVVWNGYRVSLFTFELRPGNPYGIVSLAVYNTIRGIIYIIVTIIVFAKLVKGAYAGGSTKALSALKEAATAYILAIAMLTLMPYFFDVLLYIRDVFLYAVASKLGADVLKLDVSNLSLISMFKDIASNSLMNSLMYLGTIFLTLWFAITYASLAMSFVIYFFAFPFVCMNMQFEKNALGEWWKQMVYSLLIPISDIVLLFLPLTFGSLGNTLAIHILQFLICTMLIPARTQLRSAIGIRTNVGMELAGIATLMGAASFARSVAGTATKVGAGLSGAASDRKMSNMYSEMAEREVAQKNEFADMYNQTNGYGKHNGVVGAKEIKGVDSLSSGIAGLSSAYGLPIGALDHENAFNNDPSHLMGGIGGVGGGSGMGTAANQDILDKYANISNFESSEFSGISAERKAELYKQRAGQRTMKALSTATGGALGAGMGAGAATFLSPAAKMQMAGIGMGAGAALGSTVPGVASAIGKGVVNAGKGAYGLGSYAQLKSDFKDLQKASRAQFKDYDILDHYNGGGGNSRVEEAETQFANSMGTINSAAEQAMGLNEYLDIATSPDNQELSSYMDNVYHEIMQSDGAYANVGEMQNEMSRRCIEHVMSSSESYITNNIHGAMNADSDVNESLINSSRNLINRRISSDLSPQNISKYGNGKYTFQ